MTIKLNKPMNLFLLMLSVSVVLAFVPQQVDARKGARGGGGGQARTSVNRGGGNKANNVNRNTNNNRNTNVNRNTNINNNVNVDVNVNTRHGYGHRHYHPVATGAAIAVTAAVIGSIVYSLPSGCSTVIRNGISYQQCGSTWYQPQYSGSNVTYVVINEP